ncbi:MAG: PD-(D/E)XK nuclease family protein, partial [Oscillospiraceae bacterium]|nr:PD-(D/E)XK nuclease family protein [Oscillospiraceae bacterium]
MTLISHPKAAVLREQFGIYESFRYDDDFNLSFEKAEPTENYQEITDSVSEEKYEFDETAAQKLREAFNFRYDDSLVNVTSKLSVSDISKNDDTQLLLLKRPDFASDNGEMSAAEKGTALHSFLQFADFNRLEQDFEAEKECMIKYGHITKKQGTAVKKEDIDAFLISDLYSEIKNAAKIIRERKFLVSIEDLELDDEFGTLYEGTDGMIGGIMDMIIEKDDSVILVDYKTDKVENASLLANRYRKQLLLYKKALEIIQDKPVQSAMIYPFFKKESVKVF